MGKIMNLEDCIITGHENLEKFNCHYWKMASTVWIVYLMKHSDIVNSLFTWVLSVNQKHLKKKKIVISFFLRQKPEKAELVPVMTTIALVWRSAHAHRLKTKSIKIREESVRFNILNFHNNIRSPTGFTGSNCNTTPQWGKF